MMYGRNVAEIEAEQELQRLKEIHMKKELEFQRELLDSGYRVETIDSDGNCLFSALADQIYGNKDFHAKIRNFVCDYMEIERNYFRPFIIHPRGPLAYINEMRKDGKWGDDIEIQVLSEIYNVKIEVFNHSWKPIKTFNEKAAEEGKKTVRLLYLQLSHYDSLHKLDEKDKVIDGAFGTLEEIVLEEARDRVKNGGGHGSSLSKVPKFAQGQSKDRGDLSRAVKKNVTEAMKASMESYNQELQKNNEEEIMKQIMKESEKQFADEQEKIMERIRTESREQWQAPKKLPPIQQVVNMGFPMELALKAYNEVGDDVPTMISYIYEALN